MANNVEVTPGSGALIGTEEVVDPDLGTVQMQVVKLADGALGGYQKAKVTAAGSVYAEGPGATGAPAVGQPLRTAGLAANALPSGSTVGNIVEWLVDTLGRRCVTRAPLGTLVRQVVTVTGTAETTIVNADVSKKLDLFNLVATGTNATATLVNIRAATGGGIQLVLAVGGLQTIQLAWPPDLPMLQGAATNNWTAQLVTGAAAVTFTANLIRR